MGQLTRGKTASNRLRRADNMETFFPEDWLIVLKNIYTAAKPKGCFYFTVETALDSEIEKVFKSAKQKNMPRSLRRMGR